MKRREGEATMKLSRRRALPPYASGLSAYLFLRTIQ